MPVLPVYCDKCRRPFASQKALEQHNQSGVHDNTSDVVYLRCTLCSTFCTGFVAYGGHVLGARHQRAIRRNSNFDPGPEELEAPPNHISCDLCRTFVPKGSWHSHENGKRHRIMKRCVPLKKRLDETEPNKNGIVITEDTIDFGILPPNNSNSQKKVLVTNSVHKSIVLLKASLSSNGQGSSFHLPNPVVSVLLCRTSSTNVLVTFSSRGIQGRHIDRLELNFKVPDTGEIFVITRPIEAIVGSAEDHKELKATSQHSPFKKKKKFEVADYEDGVRPPALAEIKWVNSLGSFAIPPSLIECAFKGNEKPRMTAGNLKARFQELRQLSPGTYARNMQYMVWIEEEQASRDLGMYDMRNCELKPKGVHYELRVDGLAEKRPSVIVSDRILVRLAGTEGRSFCGYVHYVRENTVLLQFSPKFSGLKGQKYDVHFVLNRTVFRRMHQAITCEPSFPRILFPSMEKYVIPKSSTANVLVPFERRIATNLPQLKAVQRIVSLPKGSIPFIVFGPPGTGKTVTIVEAIRQKIRSRPEARILACAPSNSAADLLAERLKDLGKSQLIRIVAPSRTKESISEGARQFTHSDSRGIFVCPPVNELSKYRVVVSTCCNAPVLFGINMPRGHFSHIFIDEAGQGTEPEIMMPIKTMAGPDTNVILSGDMKQLGPIVRSAVAIELGLDQSYLDRLTSAPIYKDYEKEGNPIVQLTKNWRSHPAILRFPNQEFYANRLEPCADPIVTHSICGKWDRLVKQNFPIIFHGVKGKDQREASSPSFFNIDEATIVKNYVKDLLEEKRLQLKPEDIGIIAPYRAQVSKIRQLLRNSVKATNIGGPDGKGTRVGSVEEFQGQERRVIIISTVRSSEDEVEFDLRHTLGFVAHPRRFNVAVTRAQALLIIVGDPHVLSLDPRWRRFMNYIIHEGGYRGKEIDWDPDELVEDGRRLDDEKRERALTQLEELVLRTTMMDLPRGEGEGDEEEEEEVRVFNRPWREDE